MVYAPYWFIVILLFIYGMNSYILCYLFLRKFQKVRLGQSKKISNFKSNNNSLPKVTVQLPIFNEFNVVEKLIKKVYQLNYPRHLLEIQILDDSTDETSQKIKSIIDSLDPDKSVLKYIHRIVRTDFKAGALREGTKISSGDFIAIFDADFLPNEDFLFKTIPFFDDENIAFVQARWGHLNSNESFLTKVQALAIDGHFGIEQGARAYNNLFLNFNGTAGVWRKKAIKEAGGWSGDTLTEDLDLSYRVQLLGYRGEYLLDVDVPAEIPNRIIDFKSQQKRWAKGSIQTAIKILPRLWSSRFSIFEKVQGTIHLTHYLVHPLMILLALASLPVVFFKTSPWEGVPFILFICLLLIGTLSTSSLYVLGQKILYKDWYLKIYRIPILMLIGTGIAVSNTKAVFEGIIGIKTDFIRTPKYFNKRKSDKITQYILPKDKYYFIELLLGLYTSYCLYEYLKIKNVLIGPFLLIYALGFYLVFYLTFIEYYRSKRGSQHVK